MAAVEVGAGERRVRTGSNARLRRQSVHLEPLDIPNDNHRNVFFSPPPTVEETRQEGKALLGRFIEEQINRDGEVDTPEEIINELHLLTPQGYANPAWAKCGQDLRRYADDFMKSKERKKVKQRAYRLIGEDNIDGCVTESQFQDFLGEFLSGGITRERIIVLFVFCADIAIATLKKKAIQLCQQFIQWSVQYITAYVCSWVQRNGGWEVVLGFKWKYLKRVAIFISVGAAVYYGVKKLSSWSNN